MIAMSKKREWLTMAEAAKALGVSRQRMHQIVDETNAETSQVNPRLTVIHCEELVKIQKMRESEKVT